MRVLLVSPNTVINPYPVYPLGLDYIRQALIDRHEVEILDLNVLGGLDELKAAVKRFRPDLIGLSLRNIDTTDITDPRAFVDLYREVAAAVRSVSSSPLVLGGSGFTIFPRELMAALGADYGIVGEGERLAQLIEGLEFGGDLSRIPGLVIGKGVAPIPGPLSGAGHRGFDTAAGHVAFYLKRGGMLNLQSKRGCCFNCIYCTYPHIEGRKLRLIPPDEVARTALALQAAGAKFFFITDSAFNADYRHSLAVARAFKREGVNIPWGSFFAPTQPPADYFKTLAEAGLTHIEFGTESLSDTVLAAYQKPFRTRQVMASHEAAVAVGCYVAHYLILGGPGEDAGTVDETLNNIDKLNRTVLFFFLGMRIYPHTDLYERALAEGQITRGEDLLSPTYYQPKAIQLDQICERVRERAAGRRNWVIGAGGEEGARIIETLYGRGFTGPLWEHLVR
jgi:radical SAM superfamily enzyme YgiQ (UPF0313 family)